MFAPEKGYTVYERNYRWSDGWSGFDYGIDFDFSKTFFEQFDALLKKVPLPNVLNSNTENSDYVNQTDGMKNCYLMFSSRNSEHCYYGNRVFYGKYCLDCSLLNI